MMPKRQKRIFNYTFQEINIIVPNKRREERKYQYEEHFILNLIKMYSYRFALDFALYQGIS